MPVAGASPPLAERLSVLVEEQGKKQMCRPHLGHFPSRILSTGTHSSSMVAAGVNSDIASSSGRTFPSL